MTILQLEDIQGILLSGYGHLGFSTNYFLQFGDVAPARQWLAETLPQVTTATPWPKDANGNVQKPRTGLNLAFTRQGLEVLEVPLQGFSTEFIEGIAGPTDAAHPDKLPNRSRRLGDMGANAPFNWVLGGPNNPPVHLLVILFAATPEERENLKNRYLLEFSRAGMSLLFTEDTYVSKTSREPFGFLDGLSQPSVEGTEALKKDNVQMQTTVKAGEFILGYKNEFDLYPPMPTNPRLGSNGSYLVYRKLEQDVAGFWNYAFRQAGGEQAVAEVLAAKMVGRWRSGAPLTTTPQQDDPALGEDFDRNNNFLYADTDLPGTGCPVGSHIRRTNPRDALLPDPPASLDAVKKHRILRRGRIYGDDYPLDVVGHLLAIKAQKGLEYFAEELLQLRGLSFMAINADLKRQFEFVQQTWVNDPKFDGLYNDKDPLLANESDDRSKSNSFTIQRVPLRKELKELPRFVTTRGGGYFFVPGITALRFISGQG